MNHLGVIEQNIPGTILKREKMGGVTGLPFLKKIFFVTDGIMLSQVREISGVDGSTLQNWVKRGWVANPVNKMYNIDQLARILIINMLRDTVQLSKISFLLKYINGSVNSREDDIIPESQLYEYICRILDTIVDDGVAPGLDLRKHIEQCTLDYAERISGARRRLASALEIIITAYYATLVKRKSEELLSKIGGTEQ